MSLPASAGVQAQESNSTPPVDLLVLADHAGIQSLNEGDTVSGIAPFQGAGEVSLTAVPHPNTGNSIAVTERGDSNWHSLDINLGSYPALDLQPWNTYAVTISGHVIGVPPEDAVVALQGAASPWPWLTGSGELTENGSFTLEAQLDASNLPNISQALRIQTNEAGIGMSYIVDYIRVSLIAEGVPAAAEAEIVDGEETVLWRLSTDEVIQALSGSAFDFGSHLTDSGSPYFSIVQSPEGTNAIFVDNRRVGGGEWYGVDVLFAPLGLVPGAVYQFRAWGRIAEGYIGGNMQFAQPDEPWGGFAGHTVSAAPTAADSWELELTISGSALDTALINQSGVRIATNPAGAGMNFIIDEIEVVMIGDAPIDFQQLYLITFAPDQEAVFGSWFSNTDTHGQSMALYQWGFGAQDDNYVIRGHHIGTDPAGNDGEFTAQRNALRLTLPQPLPPGVQYEISIWYFVPLDDNIGLNEGFGNYRKDELYPPGFLINGMAGNAAYTFIGAANTPLDAWVELRVPVMLANSYIETIDIRFHGNSANRFPDVWYFDRIAIYEGQAVDLVLPEWDLNLPSLAELFEPWFMFGNIYPGTTSAVMNQFDTRDMFLHHFNAITAENHHKPDQIAGPGGRITVPSPSEFDFTHADAVVDWAVANDIALIGHAFVWHSQSPNWLFRTIDNGDIVPLTRQEARDNMEFYIRTIAEHYSARGLLDAFHSWDVANEVIASGGGQWGDDLDDWNAGDWRTQMREDSPWFLAYANNADPQPDDHPSDFVYDAFVFARRYFPNAILYYNDYNEEIPAKRNAIGQMVEQINERWAHDAENNPEAVAAGYAYTGRLLIEGIGMQSHYHLPMGGWSTNFDNVRPAIERFIATGAVLSITELDITVGGHGAGAPTIPAPLPEYYANWQAREFARLFGYYIEFANYIERVSIWGLADSQSWRAIGNPLLFDGNFDPKPAFWAIVDVAQNAQQLTADIDELLPLVATVESLGGTAVWIEETRTVLIAVDGVETLLPIDTPLPGDLGMPIIINGRTFVPPAYFTEVLGLN